MDIETLRHNLQRVYVDYSDFVEDFNAAARLDTGIPTAVLGDSRTAKLELKNSTYLASEALRKASINGFTWNPDETGGNHE